MVSTYPSEKWWSESQLGWWNSIPNCPTVSGKSVKKFHGSSHHQPDMVWSIGLCLSLASPFLGRLIPSPFMVSGRYSIFGEAIPQMVSWWGDPRETWVFSKLSKPIWCFFFGVSPMLRNTLLGSLLGWMFQTKRPSIFCQSQLQVE